MELKNNLLKLFIPNKKNLLFSLILFVIAILSLFITITIQLCINDVIDKDISNKFINRDIYVTHENYTYEEVENKINDLDYISFFYKDYGFINVQNKELGILTLRGVPLDFFSSYNYRIDERYLTDNYVIIPSTISNDESIMGKTITFNYNESTSIDLTIAGIYFVDENEFSNNLYMGIDFYNYFIEENELLEYKETLHIVVENQKHVESTIKNLNNMDFVAYLSDPSGKVELNMYTQLSKMVSYFTIAIVLFILTTYILTIGAIINHEKESIAILKAIGYKNVNIFLILFMSVFLMLLFSFIISSIVFFVIAIILNRLISIYLLSYFKFNIFVIIIVFILLIILLIVSLLLYFNKLKKISIVKLINDFN